MNERELLEEYVRGGKLMQLATVAGDGTPTVCSVWYAAEFRPDTLNFLSRSDRVHSRNIAVNSAVAGAIVDIPLEELGQVVRGVSFTGRATQLPATGIEAEIAAFTGRWPNASETLRALPEGRSRLFRISVSQWLLFDEENYPGDPRRTIAGS